MIDLAISAWLDRYTILPDAAMIARCQYHYHRKCYIQTLPTPDDGLVSGSTPPIRRVVPVGEP